MTRSIVTGGFGVLGAAVVNELLAQGHRVAAIDLAPAPAKSAATASIGGIDMTDESAVAAAYADAAIALGGVEGLVNVAGGFTWEPVETGSAATWDAMYAMNVRTAAISCRAALAHLSAGAIVNVGAAAATGPGLGMAPYASSKAGVMALTESLAEELRTRGIRVNAILPTILDTPANRRAMPDADTSEWVDPASAARAIGFLLSPASAAITGVGIRLSLGGCAP